MPAKKQKTCCLPCFLLVAGVIIALAFIMRVPPFEGEEIKQGVKYGTYDAPPRHPSKDVPFPTSFGSMFRECMEAKPIAALVGFQFNDENICACAVRRIQRLGHSINYCRREFENPVRMSANCRRYGDRIQSIVHSCGGV